ncbi:MAG: hypothetical protein HY216_11610 [Candidatus Rokubacteria bacterium]|nr:hypothetical protein [Candidatus Rokubacteria bacterium]
MSGRSASQCWRRRAGVANRGLLSMSGRFITPHSRVHSCGSPNVNALYATPMGAQET